MKKIIYGLLISILFVGIKVSANVATPASKSTASEQALTKDLASGIGSLLSQDEIAKGISNVYYSYIRECKPYDVSFGFNVIDFGMETKLKVDGWVNDRCVYSLSGKINHLSDNLRNAFGVNLTDSELSKIEPVFQCKFTKTQLNKMVDAIEKESLAQMNQNDHSSKKYEFERKSQELIIKTISTPGTCDLLNAEEMMNLFKKNQS